MRFISEAVRSAGRLFHQIAACAQADTKLPVPALSLVFAVTRPRSPFTSGLPTAVCGNPHTAFSADGAVAEGRRPGTRGSDRARRRAIHGHSPPSAAGGAPPPSGRGPFLPAAGVALREGDAAGGRGVSRETLLSLCPSGKSRHLSGPLWAPGFVSL